MTRIDMVANVMASCVKNSSLADDRVCGLVVQGNLLYHSQ